MGTFRWHARDRSGALLPAGCAVGGRLCPADAVSQTRHALESSGCRNYLDKTGWSGDPLLPIIASLAYKQGAGHQDNMVALQAAVDMTR